MAFLEHSVFQNKDIGWCFQHTVHLHSECEMGAFWKSNLHSLLIRSTGKSEAGCIRSVGRGTVQMHCWYHAT